MVYLGLRSVYPYIVMGQQDRIRIIYALHYLDGDETIEKDTQRKIWDLTLCSRMLHVRGIKCY